MSRDYGYGRSRVKHIGKYELILEFYEFKKARLYIYLDYEDLYSSNADILPNNKEKILNIYRSLKTVKNVKSFIEKRNKIK